MQKFIKRYWPVLLLLAAVGYVIYIRRKANNTIGTPEPTPMGANPGIAEGEPTPGNTGSTNAGNSGGNPATGDIGGGTGGTTATGGVTNTGNVFLPDYDPNAAATVRISDPVIWMQV